MTDIVGYAQFVATKAGKTGLTPTVDVFRITRSTGASSQIVTGQNASEVGRGGYSYQVTGADLTLYDYLFAFITADATVDQQQILALWTHYGIASAIPLTAGQTADAVLDALAANHDDPNTIGELINDIGTLSVAAFPAGAITYTYTLTDSVSLLPIEGVDVWFATDNAFANIIWRGVTDAFGVARDVNNNKPQLDAGTYYIRLQKTGYSFSDDTEIVS